MQEFCVGSTLVLGKKKGEKMTVKNIYEDGFLEQNLENCRSTTMCDGGCEIHSHGTQVVRVVDKDHDWGYYRYCDTAINEDLHRGFTVIKYGEEGFPPNPVIHGERKL